MIARYAARISTATTMRPVDSSGNCMRMSAMTPLTTDRTAKVRPSFSLSAHRLIWYSRTKGIKPQRGNTPHFIKIVDKTAVQLQLGNIGIIQRI